MVVISLYTMVVIMYTMFGLLFTQRTALNEKCV
jgi:hypothetical protein